MINKPIFHLCMLFLLSDDAQIYLACTYITACLTCPFLLMVSSHVRATEPVSGELCYLWHKVRIQADYSSFHYAEALATRLTELTVAIVTFTLYSPTDGRQYSDSSWLWWCAASYTACLAIFHKLHLYVSPAKVNLGEMYSTVMEVMSERAFLRCRWGHQAHGCASCFRSHKGKLNTHTHKTTPENWVFTELSV